MLCGHLTLPWLMQAEVARSSDEDLAFMPLISKKLHEFAGFSANLLHKIQGNCNLRTKNNWGGLGEGPLSISVPKQQPGAGGRDFFAGPCIRASPARPNRALQKRLPEPALGKRVEEEGFQPPRMLAGMEPGIVRRPLRPSAADCGFPPWLRLAAMPSRGRRVLVRSVSPPRASLESQGGVGKL